MSNYGKTKTKPITYWLDSSVNSNYSKTKTKPITYWLDYSVNVKL